MSVPMRSYLDYYTLLPFYIFRHEVKNQHEVIIMKLHIILKGGNMQVSN